MHWMDSRAVSKELHDIDYYLSLCGLTEYLARELTKVTGGTLMTDCYWLRIEDSWTYYNYTIRGMFHLNPMNPYIPLTEHEDCIIEEDIIPDQLHPMKPLW